MLAVTAPQPSEKEWSCRQCGTLLGSERGDRLQLKYKTAQFAISGPVMAVLRQCSEANEMVVGRRDDDATEPERAA